MSLRTRLTVVLVLLVGAGLAVFGGVTYAALESFLTARVDDQLLASRGPMVEALNTELGGRSRPGNPRGGPLTPPGTYGEVRDSDGTLIGNPRVFEYGGTSRPGPRLPIVLALPTEGSRTFTVSAVTGEGRYRVLVERAGASGLSLLVAVPLTEVDETLDRLLYVEFAIAAVILVLTTGLSLLAVRRGLRPLDRMAATADRIAGGELSARVESVDPRTEVGRLGLALNAMLTQLESAFAQRRASEDRLRRFLVDASHELRTPLTSIRGYAELFRRGADQRPADLATSMRRIEDESARMGELVDSLLLLARLEDPAEDLTAESAAGMRGTVDLSELAADAASDLRAVAPDREVTVEVTAPAVVVGDEGRLRQLVGNLLTNTRVHTPAGTPVEVKVTTDGSEVVLTIRDHGEGLDAETRRHAFDRFWRSQKARTGTPGSGLGLSIVAAVAGLHGGTAEAGEAEGGGAVFTVRLPAAGG